MSAANWPSPFDVPTPAKVHAAALRRLSLRAQKGLAAIEDEPSRQHVAASVVAMGDVEGWERCLSRGQAYPDVIEGGLP